MNRQPEENRTVNVWCGMWNVKSEGNDDDDVCWMDAVCFMLSWLEMSFIYITTNFLPIFIMRIGWLSRLGETRRSWRDARWILDFGPRLIHPQVTSVNQKQIPDIPFIHNQFFIRFFPATTRAKTGFIYVVHERCFEKGTNSRKCDWQHSVNSVPQSVWWILIQKWSAVQRSQNLNSSSALQGFQDSEIQWWVIHIH